jgi:hypothetical protein
MEDIVPQLLAAIHKQRINKCTVQEGICGNKWISDIRGALTVGVIVEYLHLWNILSNVGLHQEVHDSHFWGFTTNGKFSVKSAYEGFFYGSVKIEPFERVWRTCALAKCQFFVWLVTLNKCWTADRLAKRGLDCDQEEEDTDHLLLSCVFVRDFWFRFLQQVQLQELAPQLEDKSFMDWWRKIDEESLGSIQKGFNSLIILGAWTMWMHHNMCIFDGIAPSLVAVLS